MKHVVIAGLALAWAGAAAAQVSDQQAPGNLAATTDPGCIAVADAGATLSPPDLGLGVVACGQAGDWDQAVGLFVLMRAADLPEPMRSRTWEEPPLIIRARDGTVHPEYAAVASSIFGIVTILLAWRFLSEAMKPVQWLGVAVVFLGIATLAAG